MTNEFEKLFKEDQKHTKLWAKKYSNSKYFKVNERLRKQVQTLVKKGLAKTGRDYFIASIILHHGFNINTSKKALQYAKKAVKLGSKEKWLIASVTDRLLQLQGKPQRFGTQWIETKKGKWEFYKVNPKTTDRGRAKYGLPKLEYLKNPSNQRPKILLAMSGGVDSSVAALLLKKQGYEVLGAFMKNWSTEKDDLGECLWQGEREYAIKVAKILGIKLITLDFEKQYRKLVVEEMFKLYKKGITPNPDIDCNNKVKFPLLIKEAKKIGCNLIATGHYARIKKSKDKYELLRAKDESKDQSYFLYRLSQKDLSKSLFPIGALTKTQIREIARKNKFPNAEKKGTVGICFIGKVNLKKFLQKKIPPKPGDILNPEGKIIGKHDGIYYYTIGQRICPRYGLDVSRGKGEQKKWYVARKNLKNNEIIAASEGHELNFRQNIIIKSPHWISEQPQKNKPTKVFSRIRQVGELLQSTLTYNQKTKHFEVKLKKPITGVSEGQAVVLYKAEKCLGGGVISFN